MRTSDTIAALLLAVTFHGAGQAAVMSFQEGTSGYAGTQDTELQEDNPAAAFGGATTISLDTNSPLESQGLIRFDGIIGAGAGQIPPGSTINSASLTVNVTNASNAVAQLTIHRMLASWSESSTWNSLTNGIQLDDVEARSTADAAIPSPNTSGNRTWSGAGVTATLQAWSDGTTNLGWAIKTTSSNNWIFRSSEHGNTSTRPILTVDYTPPTLSITKRAFRADGTPIPTGTILPRGTPVKFLLYVNNPGAMATDVSLRDVLDPTFAYVGGSLRSDGATPACAQIACSAAEESAIFAAADAGTAGSDAVDGDVVSFAGQTVDAGNQNVAQGRLDVPAARVWALIFTVHMQ